MTDRQAMLLAIKNAKSAAADGEVPVGAVVLKNGKVIGEGRNRREKGRNAVWHAEIEAIENACQTIGSWRLRGCELFVTLEPCPMCAGAIMNARLDRLVFGAYDENVGFIISRNELFDVLPEVRPTIVGGYMENECAEILESFFQNRRNDDNKI
ncbi:MAG: nucleoside deaminase [Oscillospiraceae bacterium]|nr:nucleoside deaminase [Oscillospiraceae bacterium]